jgi:transposase
VAVYANRRRVRGNRGKRLMRRRGELIERSFAHAYQTGAMRRTHLRRHENIAKRLLVHVGGFNLGLVMRRLTGCGKPRRLQGLFSSVFGLFWTLWTVVRSRRTCAAALGCSERLAGCPLAAA